MTLLYAYNFDEVSGNILDASGNGRDTVFGGSLTRTASGGGHSGTGSDKGLSQSTTAADSAGPSLTGLQTAQFTVMCWVKRSSNSQDGWIAEFKASGSGDRGILFLSGAVQARARNSGGTVQFQSTTQLTAGTWYHVAASYSTTDSKVHLFINGVESGTGAALTGPLKSTSATSSLFDGLGAETIIDDVRYYDAALDAATITTLMNTPVTPGGTGFTQTPTDAEGLTDTPAFTLGKAIADPEALTDAPRFDLSKASSDPLNLTDTATVGRGIGTAAADTLNLTDTAVLERAVAQAAADSVTLTDTALVVATRTSSATDTENLTDSTTLALGPGVTDNLGVTDQVTMDRSQVTADTIALTDSASVQLAGAGTVSATDNLGLTDAAQVTSVRDQAAADTCALSDQIALVITRDLGDTITVTDAADLTAAFVRVFADTAALTDSVAVVKGGSHGPAVQSVLTATHSGPVLTPSQSLPDLTPSNSPSSQLEVSHGV